MIITNEKRNEEIDNLRGFAAICMILGHSILRYPIDLTCVAWCSSLEHWIFTFHMELFFLIAGICYKCFDYGIMIKKKIDRVLVPYMFFGALSILLKAFGGSAVNRGEPVSSGIYKLFFTGGNYWFLYVIFFIFLTYPFIEKIFHNKVKKIILVILLLIIPFLINFPKFLMLNSFVYHLPFFVTGQLIMETWRCNKANHIQDDRTLSLNYLAVLLIALLVFSILDSLGNFYALSNVLKYFRALSIILSIYVTMKIINLFFQDRYIWNIIKKIFCECGRYSLQLYLFNGYILTVTRIILCNILKIEIPILLVLLIWFINITLTLFICEFIIPRFNFIKKICGI